MLILTDGTGVTIKQTVQSEDHVRVGVTQTAMWVHGVRRAVRNNAKPHCELSLNDCQDLLDELSAYPGYSSWQGKNRG